MNMSLVFITVEGILFFGLFYLKNQIITVPLFIIGIIGFNLEIFEMKKEGCYNFWQIARGGCLLFFELFLFLNYIFHFMDFIFD